MVVNRGWRLAGSPAMPATLSEGLEHQPHVGRWRSGAMFGRERNATRAAARLPTRPRGGCPGDDASEEDRRHDDVPAPLSLRDARDGNPRGQHSGGHADERTPLGVAF
jgi:hypothetical protein